MESRRGLLKKLGVGAAAAATTVGVSRAARAEHKRQLQAFAEGGDTQAAPWWLLQPLEAGARLSGGWHLASLSAVERGAAIIALEHAHKGQRNVHLCAHGGRPQGVAFTRLFDLILMDGGQGDRPTDPSVGKVLVHLARRIRKHELSRQGELAQVTRMLTHGERVALYGAESLT